MRTELFVQTAFEQNSRIVSCAETGKAVCIDPGEPSEETANYIVDKGLDLTAIVATHGHLDHIGGTAFMKERFPDAEILVHKDEEELYYALPMQPLAMGIQPHQLEALGMAYADPPKITRNFEHGEILEIGRLRLEVRHCPGHTLGHIVLVAHEERTVFTGDCLFSGTIGRTDLPGGNHAQLIDSIKTNVLSLDDDFVVCCGHGPDTTVGRERASNPFLNS
ncbi:MAG TPA: MBL fold metallo-hydrolase [Pyrinomonadaceae bacterium]|jgi:hydroxyacylglutathione hydrolase|nr:MBL fold metallo-hydrolase [Pyrinomonadaceae bacterium]